MSTKNHHELDLATVREQLQLTYDYMVEEAKAEAGLCDDAENWEAYVSDGDRFVELEELLGQIPPLIEADSAVDKRCVICTGLLTDPGVCGDPACLLCPETTIEFDLVQAQHAVRGYLSDVWLAGALEFCPRGHDAESLARLNPYHCDE